MIQLSTKPTTLTLVAIRKYARSLMDQHGFAHVPFAWDAAPQRAGAAWHDRATRRPTKLTLSRKVIPQFTDAQITDTILHEIAHLMTPGHSHGPAWRRACVAIGAEPTPCYDPSTSFRAASEPSSFAR